MIYKKFKIDLYNWDVFYYDFENHDEIDIKIKSFNKIANKVNISKEDLEMIENKMKNEASDGGFCFRNLSKRINLIVLFPCKKEATKINVVTHEIRHVVDDIAKHLWLRKDKEAVAYLTGYISEKVLSLYI